MNNGLDDRSWVVGPDVTKGGVQRGFIGDFLGAFKPAGAIGAVCLRARQRTAHTAHAAHAAHAESAHTDTPTTSTRR